MQTAALPEADTPPPVNGMTDASENITLPQTSYVHTHFARQNTVFAGVAWCERTFSKPLYLKFWILPFSGDRGTTVRVLLHRVDLGLRADAQGRVVQEAE